MELAWRVASRFIAGTDRDAAAAVTRDLNGKGMKVTMDFLGESVSSEADAAGARDEILRLVDTIHEQALEAGVSVKLSQLGLKISEQLAQDNVCRIVERAAEHGLFVRIDMEDSPVVDATLRIYHTLRREHGLTNVGVVIQSYLYRSEADVQALLAEGTSIRLCKGAYAEPPDVAFPEKADTDASYLHLSRLMLADEARAAGARPAFATHDEAMIREILDYTQKNKIPPSEFEFQMLHGIRRDLQDALVQQGYTVRVYVPYGTAWYPYFMRRLAERPANLYFFASNLLRA
jgi:proline dehydrogenase